MIKATKDLTLPTTITGSLPRPAWYTENLGARPFRDAFADTRFREQYTDAVGTFIRDQERAGLDIVTDGDARFDTDVGGMSWFQYPARRFKGLAGGDYYKTRKGYGRRDEGRHHLRGDGEPGHAAIALPRSSAAPLAIHVAVEGRARLHDDATRQVRNHHARADWDLRSATITTPARRRSSAI